MRRQAAGALILVLGLIGAALLYGDGAITPAISVLSAVEGLKLDAPQLTPLIVPITVVILTVLFFIQWKGTTFIGRIFGPVMLVWFLVLAILGLSGIARAPGVLAAANPLYALDLLLHAPLRISFGVLGAVFLAVTGGEAMYADMGHFGRLPIRLAWFTVALPCLALNYFGQGALLITDPSALENPFYELAPDWAHYPLIALATAAAIIASQAIISGTFSLSQQAIQLGFLPRISIRHTASHERGQIYVPLVNWLLGAVTIGAVFGFGSSEALAGAYGIAVSLLMVITTVLAALVALQWGFNPIAVLAVNGFFLVIDLIFFGANVLKLFEGGWFPLLLAFSVAFVMMTWRTGVKLVERARRRLRQPEEAFLRSLHETPPVRLPGTAAFLTAATVGMPVALVHHLKHNRVLHERLLLVSVVSLEEPRVDDAGPSRGHPNRRRDQPCHPALRLHGDAGRQGRREARHCAREADGREPDQPDLLYRARNHRADGAARHGPLARGGVFHSPPQCRALGGVFLCSDAAGGRDRRGNRDLNHAQFESDNSCRLGWAVRVPI